MPIYTYRCKDCEYEFEQRQRMSADPLQECPRCNGRLRRVVNSVGVVFKGNGFYVTDNRNGVNGSSSASSAKSGKETAGEEKKSSTSDTKSSESTTPKPAASSTEKTATTTS